MAEHTHEIAAGSAQPPLPARPRWWRDWRWIMTIAVCVLALAMTGWAVASVQTKIRVEDQTQVINEIHSLGEANHETLDRLSKNQAGIDELVAFVHEIEAQQSTSSSSGGGQSRVVQDVITILCSSSDPVRQAACDRLGYGHDGG